MNFTQDTTEGANWSTTSHSLMHETIDLIVLLLYKMEVMKDETQHYWCRQKVTRHKSHRLGCLRWGSRER